jgi:CheY-like chemotaxis protein
MWIRQLRDVTLADVPTVGGKNASLGELLRELVPLGVNRGSAQATIAGTPTTEMRREGQGGEDGEGLHTQAVEESAPPVSAIEGLAGMRAAPTLRDGSRPEESSTTARRWPRVLVVEDDDATRVAIERGLAPEYEVVAAGNGMEGLKVASETAFDAIVTDIGMPEMDGVTMVDRIRRMRAPAVVPVVFLTAETAPERVVAGLSVEGTSYLVKPVDLDRLDQELRLALAGSSGPSRDGPSSAWAATRATRW